MLDAAGKRQPAPACGDAKLTSRRRNTPARAREEAQRVERPLAELHLVKEDERALAVEWDALVLCDTPHDGIDVVSRTVEERGDKIEVGLKVELHELVPGHTLSNRLDHIGLADAARATQEKGTLRRCAQSSICRSIARFNDGPPYVSGFCIHHTDISRFHVIQIHEIEKYLYLRDAF